MGYNLSRANADYRRLICSRAWRGLRLRLLRAQPLCADCQARGVYRAAEELHHVTPVESGASAADMRRLCFNPNNIRPLCKDCHKAAHVALRWNGKDAQAANNRTRAERFAERFL